jgi:hypothetical protein
MNEWDESQIVMMMDCGWHAQMGRDYEVTAAELLCLDVMRMGGPLMMLSGWLG